jgi:integrase
MPEMDRQPQRRRKGRGGVETDAARGMYRGFYTDAACERVRLPWCRSREDAEQQLQAALEMVAESHGLSVGAPTLRKWGELFLDKRELDGHRAARHDMNRWHQYVVAADFIDWPLESITRRDVKLWLTELKQVKTFGRGSPPARPKKGRRRAPPKKPQQFLSWQTRKHALVLLRKAFDAAIDEEKVSDNFVNPCAGLKVKRPATTEVRFNFLARDEIAAVQSVAPAHIRPLIEFAIATGLRQGEMRALRDEDVHLDAADLHITVRYGGTPKKPTKSGLPRDVPLLPMAQRALREWYALRKTWCSNNFKALTFPAARGGYRSAGKILGRDHQKVWKGLLAAAGIARHLVWHDLRHTCATALLGGYFGKKWRLEEIQQLLGHADIETTQTYAHQLKQTLHDAARETTGDIEPDDDE